jgi:hypothetical protein
VEVGILEPGRLGALLDEGMEGAVSNVEEGLEVVFGDVGVAPPGAPPLLRVRPSAIAGGVWEGCVGYWVEYRVIEDGLRRVSVYV